MKDSYKIQLILSVLLAVFSISVFIYTISSIYKLNSLPSFSVAFNSNSQLAQVVSPLDTDPYLVGWWKFDETSGTSAADSSGKGNNGTLTNGPTWSVGKMNGGLQFDGVNDFVDLDSASLIGTQALTVCSWVNPRSIGGNSKGTIIGNSQFLFRISTANALWVTSNGEGANTASLANSVPFNAWTFACATRDSAGLVNFFINGQPNGVTNQDSGTPASTAWGAAIGARASGLTYNWDGSLDDVRVYNRLLSQNEINALYTNTSPSSGGGTANQAPTVSAGSNQNITLPGTATLSGTASDDGLPAGSTLTTSWSMVSGPGTVTFSNPNSLNVTASFSTAGTYVLRLSASDTSLTTSSDVTVIVNPAQVNSTGTGHIYWASPNGSASWANCQSATDPGTNYCSIFTANSNLKAGDTVYLKGGTYGPLGKYQIGIGPVNSGTDINTRISYIAAPGETPIIAGAGCTECGWGLVFRDSNYIKVDGITFLNLGRMDVFTDYSSHNEISHNVFKNDTGEEGSGFYMYDDCAGNPANSVGCYVTNNWIHNNTFSKVGSSEACIEGSDLFEVGIPNSPSFSGGAKSGENNYNTIENNYMEYGGHAVFETYGRYLVIRNNVFHNEPWIPDFSGGKCTYPPVNGKYGHRNIEIHENYGRDGTYLLIEGNRAGNASANPNNDGADNIALGAPKNIVRENYLYNAAESGLYFKIQADSTSGINNRVYNNTIFHNGYTYPPYYVCPGPALCPDDVAGISITGTAVGNIIKNNIVYDNNSNNVWKSDIVFRVGHLPTATDMLQIVNNWTTPSGDPKFVNPNLSQPSSSVLPDLSLQSSSPAIDKGTYLTQATNSGSNSTNLVVSDALYFQDGTWGSDLARAAGGFQADWIAVGTVNNVVQIQSVNYANNTITLKSPITWSTNAPVWLFKDSSGKQVLYGSAPDMGASEYNSGQVVAPPINPNQNPVNQNPPVQNPNQPANNQPNNPAQNQGANNPNQPNVNNVANPNNVVPPPANNLPLGHIVNRLATTFRFTRSLSLGQSNITVKSLQIFLNDHGFTVTPTIAGHTPGAGSLGHESSYFGPATKHALIKFQEYYASEILAPVHLIKGTGYFGPSTIKKVNGLIGAGK